MTYQKAKVEVLANMPVAGGCGDAPNQCSAMSYWKSGTPGCGDAPNQCDQQSYWK